MSSSSSSVSAEGVGLEEEEEEGEVEDVMITLVDVGSSSPLKEGELEEKRLYLSMYPLALVCRFSEEKGYKKTT